MGTRLQGKRAIITGAASGIGRASAQLFASEGASVLIADWAEEGLAETKKLIEAAGGKVISMKLDAGNEADVKNMADRAVSELGGIDVLFANAGISGTTWLLADTTLEEFQNVVRVNLLGVFLALKYCTPPMQAQGKGSIICTASVAGLRANAGPIAYSATKAGVISLVQSVSASLRGTGIRINAICPGLIETGMTKPIFDYVRSTGKEHKVGQLNALLRAGQPSEIATTALFLASDDASYVNGQAITVDGGLSASHPFIPPR